MMSVISVLPDTCMDWDEMTCMGLVLTAFGEAMREPVTTISCSGSAGAAATAAGCCAKAGVLVRVVAMLVTAIAAANARHLLKACTNRYMRVLPLRSRD